MPTAVPQTSASPTASPTSADRARITRRNMLRRMFISAALLGVGSMYASQFEPFWLEVHEMPMPVVDLPEQFEGFRIAHLTDLHAGESVPIDYLRRAIERVNDLKPDCVVVTGDLVTHDPNWIAPVCEVLAKLKAPLYVTFGNHDYDPLGALPGPVTIISDMLVPALTKIGAIVLRNQSVAIERDGARLWMVGLEDFYTTRFLPSLAFRDVPSNERKICLSHNPDGTAELLHHKPDLILSGHTHGGQIRLPLWGAIMLPVSDHSLDQGLRTYPHSQLYISRGVGFLLRARLDCRPEIPVFRLGRANV